MQTRGSVAKDREEISAIELQKSEELISLQSSEIADHEVSRSSQTSDTSNDSSSSQSAQLCCERCRVHEAEIRKLTDEISDLKNKISEFNSPAKNQSNGTKDLVNSDCTQSINSVIALPEKKKQKKKRKKKATSVVANVNNSVIDSTLLENQASRSTNVSDSVNPKKKVVVIAGDSMVQDIIGPKMNAKDSTHYFVVKSFSGATVSDMDDYVKPLVRQSPDKLVLHIWTNDVKSSSPQEIIR